MLRPTIAAILFLSLWALSSFYLKKKPQAPAIATPKTTSSVRSRRNSRWHAHLDRLPTLLVSASEDPEQRSKRLMETSVLFGKIEKQLAQDPGLTGEGLQFYLACAKKEEILGSVRAVCLKNFLEGSEKVPNPPAVDLTQFSPQLLQAVHFLSET